MRASWPEAIVWPGNSRGDRRCDWAVSGIELQVMLAAEVGCAALNTWSRTTITNRVESFHNFSAPDSPT